MPRNTPFPRISSEQAKARRDIVNAAYQKLSDLLESKPTVKTTAIGGVSLAHFTATAMTFANACADGNPEPIMDRFYQTLVENKEDIVTALRKDHPYTTFNAEDREEILACVETIFHAAVGQGMVTHGIADRIATVNAEEELEGGRSR